MFDGRVGTKSVPQITGEATPTSPKPTPLIERAGRDCVVRVRNNSFGVYLLVAYDEAVLTSFNGPVMAGTWKIPAGAVDFFVVAAGQSLFASTPGVGAEVSVHVYESLPVNTEGG